MSIMHSWLGGATLAGVYLAYVHPPNIFDWFVVLVLMAIGTALWVFSPLPDHNGGYRAPGDRGTYWGFSRKD